MERESSIYKLRRKAQVVAHLVFPDDIMSKFYFWVVLKKKLNLDHPQTFNEKLQWLKLYYYPKESLAIQCADKYAVRRYISEKGYDALLVPLLGVWDNPTDIPWATLPNQFVLKCNHGCAYNIVCTNRNEFDTTGVERQLHKWLKEDFGAYNIELHYSAIKKHKVICEQYLGERIVDYKFFCFNGEPKYIYVSTDLIHDRQAQMGFFYMDGSKMPLQRDDYSDIASVELPPFFEEMQLVAKDLCKDFPFVRVDFFLANNRYYFAELTFTPGACMMPFKPERFDLEWGKELDLRAICKLR